MDSQAYSRRPSPPPSPLLRRFWEVGILLRLSRPVNILILTATGLSALILVHREQRLLDFQIWAVIWLILSADLIMAGGYWLNDLYDVEIDAINRPDRAARVEALTRHRLLAYTLWVWGLGLAVTLLLPWSFRVVHGGVVIALFWYNRWGKRWGLMGNLLVAALTALLPWEILLLTGRTCYAVDWMIPLAALFNFVRELIKDAEDRAGDVLYGVRSVPLRLSPTQWRFVRLVSWGSLLVIVFLPALMKYLLWKVWPVTHLFFVSIGSAGPLVYGLWYLSDYRLLSRLLKVAMGGGLLSLWFL